MAEKHPQDDAQLSMGMEGHSPEVARDIREGSATIYPFAVDKKDFSTKEQRQEFFIPVSGFIWLYPEEVEVVDHPTFQRLGRIYQLGQTCLVYRGATHKRLEHVLGAVAVVQRMIDAIQHNGRKNSKGGTAKPLSIPEERFIRLGTILHDIGHLAAGHTVEDELCLVGKHDADERLDMVFHGDRWADAKNRTLATLVDSLFSSYVPAEIEQSVSASEIVRLLIRKKPSSHDRFAPQQEALESSASIRLQVCHDIIGNTICADLLDYLHRDWYHIGKPRQFDDRILQYMEVRSIGSSFQNRTASSNDNFVISLGRSPKIRTDAISNILELLEWRYQLMECAIFHRTKLAAAAMLDRALYELWGENTGKIEELLLPLSDEEMLSKCLELAKEKGEEKKSSHRESGAVAAKLLKGLERRVLFSHLSTRFYGDLPTALVKRIRSTYGRDPDDPKKAAENRNRVLRLLESDFKLPSGSLAMYCPDDVNQKIAEVKIAVGDEILAFHEYEKRYNNELSGGHLDAQLHRFDRLWRVHFFIDQEVKDGLGEQLHVLQRAIEKLALRNLVDDEDDTSVAQSLAIQLTQTPGSPWHGHAVRELAVTAAYQDSSEATGRYPLGPESIRSHVQKD